MILLNISQDGFWIFLGTFLDLFRGVSPPFLSVVNHQCPVGIPGELVVILTWEKQVRKRKGIFNGKGIMRGWMVGVHGRGYSRQIAGLISPKLCRAVWQW